MSPAIEDTMFFTRLRRHAKWMFVLLALVFGLGFVVFGVGAGGVGVGDVFRGGGGGDGPSVSDARKATAERPNDADAWRELATALQTDGQTGEAILALDRYTTLRQNDLDALRELGSLYLARAGERQQEAQLAQARAAYSGTSTAFVPSLQTPDGQTILGDRITSELASGVSREVSSLLVQAQSAYEQAVSVYQELAEKRPNDPNVQLELGQIALQANDREAAIRAYERFLELAPDDANAAIVRDQLRQLRQSG